MYDGRQQWSCSVQTDGHPELIPASLSSDPAFHGTWQEITQYLAFTNTWEPATGAGITLHVQKQRACKAKAFGIVESEQQWGPGAMQHQWEAQVPAPMSMCLIPTLREAEKSGLSTLSIPVLDRKQEKCTFRYWFELHLEMSFLFGQRDCEAIALWKAGVWIRT